MITLGFKYGVVSHAHDWEEVPHVIVAHAGPATLQAPALIQVGAGWARVVFGDKACAYGVEDELVRQFPEAKVTRFKDAWAPPPLG